MFNEFISFDKMMTPTLIKVLFWIGVAASVITGLTFFQEGFFGFILGLVIIVVGSFLSRIYCELLIVFFKIHESLVELNKKVDHLK